MITNIVATFLHVGIAYYLVEHMQWHIYGVSIASCVHFIARFLVLNLLIRLSGKFEDSL